MFRPMKQITDSDLRYAIKRELALTNRPTLLALTGAPGDREDALSAITARIMQRMAAWEILVPEGPLNIFMDRPSEALKEEDARRREEMAGRPREQG